MKSKYTNHMKATVWTPTMRAEMEGPPDACIPMAFYALSTPERRESCIALLQNIHAELNAEEATKEPQR